MRHTNTMTKAQAELAEKVARAALTDVSLDPSLLEAYEIQENDYDLRCLNLSNDDERTYRAGALGLAAAQAAYEIYCVKHWRTLGEGGCRMRPAGEVVRLGFPYSCEEGP